MDTLSSAIYIKPVRAVAPPRYGQTLLHLAVGHFATVVTLSKHALDGISESHYHQGWENDCLQNLREVTAGLGRIVALYHRSSTSYQIP